MIVAALAVLGATSQEVALPAGLEPTGLVEWPGRGVVVKGGHGSLFVDGSVRPRRLVPVADGRWQPGPGGALIDVGLDEIRFLRPSGKVRDRKIDLQKALGIRGSFDEIPAVQGFCYDAAAGKVAVVANNTLVCLDPETMSVTHFRVPLDDTLLAYPLVASGNRIGMLQAGGETLAVFARRGRTDFPLPFRARRIHAERDLLACVGESVDDVSEGLFRKAKVAVVRLPKEQAGGIEPLGTWEIEGASGVCLAGGFVVAGSDRGVLVYSAAGELQRTLSLAGKGALAVAGSAAPGYVWVLTEDARLLLAAIF
jgi:hypothetical protein